MTIGAGTVPATVVPNVLTDLLTLDVSGFDRIVVHLVVAVAALTEFAIKFKGHSSFTGVAPTLYSTTNHFTVPAGLLVATSDDLSLAGVGNHWFIMDVKGISTLTLAARSGGTATLAIFAGGG